MGSHSFMVTGLGVVCEVALVLTLKGLRLGRMLHDSNIWCVAL